MGGTTLATLKDVAAHAGVSLATAARLLRGDPTIAVRPETRTRVLAAASELRYRPNRLASGLRTRRAGTVAVFLPDPRNLGWTEMLDGIDEVARGADHLVAVSDIQGPVLDPDTFGRFALEGRVDGAIVAVSLVADELLARLAATGMALVPVNGRSPAIPGSVTMQDGEGSRLAVEALVAAGHRRIGFVTGIGQADVARRREQGYRDGLAAQGIAADAAWVEHGAFTTPGAAQATRRLLRLARARRPTAVIGLNLTMALGVVAAARSRGLAVPGDLSVIAFDDHPIEDHVAPPLTAVAMPMRAMGIAAASMLFASLAGEPMRHVVVPERPRLVMRASTAPPAR